MLLYAVEYEFLILNAKPLPLNLAFSHSLLAVSNSCYFKLFYFSLRLHNIAEPRYCQGKMCSLYQGFIVSRIFHVFHYYWG